MHKRAIVYPQGLPSRASAAEHCSALVAACGGDTVRQFERTYGSLAHFGSYLARLPAFQYGHVEAVVVLTQTSPVDLVVPTRRLLKKVPGLDRAAWLLFWDHEEHPRLPEQLTELGTIDGPLAEAPLWHPGSGGRPFLVLSTLCETDTVRRRVGNLTAVSARVSEIRGLGHPPKPTSRAV